MRFKKYLFPLLSVLLATSFSVNAESVSLTDKEQVILSLKSRLPEIKIVSINPSPVDGIYEVELWNDQLIYASNDGKHLFSGDLISLDGKKITNLTGNWRAKRKSAALTSLNDDDLVVFNADGDEKAEILVFTDTDCGYCRKLHAEIPALNRAGITVKYAAWPRAGIDSSAGQTLVNVWCSDDRRSAMTTAKAGQYVPKPAENCSDTALVEQIKLGQKLGIQGTPAVFNTSGDQIGGYATAAEIIRILDVK